MKSCENCGMIYDETTGGCPNCARISTGAGVGTTVWQTLKSWFSAPLTLAIAIVLSAASVFSVIAGNIPVIEIIITIGMWIAYAAAKSEDIRMSPTGLKMISGSIKATKIIMYVAFGLLIFAGIVLIVTGTSFSASGYPAADAFKDSFDMMPYGYDAYNIYSNFVYGVGFTVFGIVILIAAVVVLLINIFFYRKAHKVARSICVSAETGILSVEKSKGVRIWMLVMGILTAISALNSLATAGIINDFSESFFEELNLHIHYSPLPAVLASICTAAAHILGYVWMKKNLTQFNDEGAPVQYAPVNTYYDAPQQGYAQQPQDYVQQAPTAMDAKAQELNGFMHEAAQQFTTPVQEASAEPDITAQTPAIETTQQAVDAINEVKSQLEDEVDDTPQDMVEDVLEDTFEDAQSDAQSTEDEYFTDNEDTEE